MASVLVCDDERSLCQLLEIDLRKQGYKVETVNTRDEALRRIDNSLYDVIVTDLRMPSMEDGLQVMTHARKVSPDSALIVTTASEDLGPAIQAVRSGAFEYILKKGRFHEEIKTAIGRAMEIVELRRQNLALRRDAASRNSLDHILGLSPAMEQLKQTIRTVAPTGSTVAIHGESGTGKELVARAIHDCSPRAAEAFVSINCGAFPETLLESELFGYVKGAFTGASQNKRGLFEVASGGTIFLDEIGEMSLAMQVKLLRVLQERALRPVGGSAEVPVDVRVIAATNRDLSLMVAEGGFREDLYYRIRVIPIDVPPLRDRRDDIPVLANAFLKKYARSVGKSLSRIAKDSLAMMIAYDWPGNVRQLENAIERAVALETSDELHVELPAERQKAKTAALPGPGTFPTEGLDFEKYVSEVERTILQGALQQANGVQTKAADLLRVSYRSLRHLLKKYRL
ncbi:MAG: sigma-54-dependent Fis family transcriptional regulator [Acidobacteriales bacterium]|nr:sigma-54-dependent Fis family transcriptional regulator [Terriglobales bacterium]